MTTAPRPRFSIRIGLADAPEHDGPYEGVPDHLLVPLQNWVEEALNYGGGVPEIETARRLCLRLRMPPKGGHRHGREYLVPLMEATGVDLLDVVDGLLGQKLLPWRKDVLSAMLDDAGSAYRINEARNGLEEKVTPAVRDAVRQTIADAAGASSAGSAADHLATAWQAAYGRGPDPVRAYSEAIKAVEGAAHAVIQPNNAKATLGTMLGELKNARHKFTVTIDSPGDDAVLSAEAMMRTLWTGQTSRHGSQTGTVPETLEAARAGVHLAATLVQWFISGAVNRTS
ncbi:hypothetical protein ACIGQC_28215 [Streptomyces albidoflavus]|uniref:hypothetical protein n=1 Tax=Streptomyces sp. CBG33 TaxID=2762624 RepID=UPI0021BD045F|nr:hypothetical protein [Streptomyces sp. CBG33]